MALTPCVHLTQWSVIGNKLYLEVRQEAVMPRGLVANILIFYTPQVMAMECILEPAEIIWNIHQRTYL